MSRKRQVVPGAFLVFAIAALAAGQAALEASARQPAREAPIFEVDPLWPKPLPNHWLPGSTVGVGVDSRDVPDGYGNRRVAVIDMDTGERKRYWGADGNEREDIDLGPYDPDAPPAPQFRNPVHCAEPTLDGFVYVCDRPNDRVQVFRKDGTFVKEAFIAPRTPGDGSVWDIARGPRRADPRPTP
ncbi:MAG TPA: hypothetical protein VF192_04015 [Longimicrobiales bacterium]